MKGIKEFFFGKEEEIEIPPFPGMQPFAVEKKRDAPTEAEIHAEFTKLMKELDFESMQRLQFESMSAGDKWKFIQSQQEHEKRVPTPEWIIQQLSDHFDIHYIISIGLNLRTARLSWVDRFCAGGGHILLVRELVRHQAYHQLFLNNFTLPPEQANEILKTLKSIVDTRQGSQNMLLFVKAIEVIVCSINIFDHKQFETVIYIVLPYVFMEEGPRLLLQAFKNLAHHNNHRLPFRIFADEISAGGDSIFTTFICGLYGALTSKYELRLKLSIEYQKANIPSVLKKLNSSPALIEAIERDINEIGLVFQGATECLLSSKQFGAALNEKTIAAIIPQLFSIEKNFSHEVYERFTSYSQAFLSRFRVCILNNMNVEAALEDAQEFAKSGSQQPVATGGQNHYAQYLAKKYQFAADSELREMTFPEAHGGLKEEIASLKAELESLRSLDAEGLRRDLEAQKAINDQLRSENAKLSEVSILQENNALKARIQQLELEAQAHKFASAEAEQSEKLKADNAQLLQENAGLHSQLAAAQEFINAIPLVAPNLSPSKIPALVSDLNTIKNDCPQAIASRLQEVINAALAYDSIIADERALTNGQLSEISNLHSGILKSLGDTQKKYVKQSETTKESTEGTTRHFPWRILESADGIWEKMEDCKIESFEPLLQESFAAVEVPEGSILSRESLQAYTECLNRSGLSPEELANGIKLEKFSISVGSLEALHRLPASPLELKKIREIADKSTLSPVEQFAVLLDAIPNWRNSIINMLEYHRFDDEISVIQSTIQKTENALKTISKSKWLPTVLKAVLMTGNYLNGDKAKAYSIQCLSNLRTFLTNDGKSLAHIIADICGDSDIEIEKIRQATASDIVSIIARLRNGQAALARRPVSEFTVSAARRITNIIKAASFVVDSLLITSNQFGLEFGIPGSSSFFQVILNLINDIQRAIKENITFKAPPKVFDVKEPVRRILKQIDPERQRGILTTMINALKANTNTTKLPEEPEEVSDFQIAFSRVRKNISKE